MIAIDGPAGTGKSSVTKRLADNFGFIHVDTGALYRAVALLTLERLENQKSRHKTEINAHKTATKRKTKTPVHHIVQHSEASIAIHVASKVHLEFKKMKSKNPMARIFANKRDLTDLIRTPAVSMAASRISAIPEVRAALLELQRKLGGTGNTILEGRDIGTVIFPDADVKFFLTASLDERAKRRWIELEAMGSDAPSFEEIKKQILERDSGDSTRTVAPLKKADDAVGIDTTTLTLDQVVAEMANKIKDAIQ